MKRSVPYSVSQLIWMLKSAAQLIILMSTGAVWVLQMTRLYLYAACVWVFFVPHCWWYLTSSNIIRRVSYRSSQTTRRRNLLRVLEAEGVADLTDLLKREQRLHRQQQIRAGRQLPARPRRRRPNSLTPQQQQQQQQRSDTPSSPVGRRPPPPPRRRPAASEHDNHENGSKNGPHRQLTQHTMNGIDSGGFGNSITASSATTGSPFNRSAEPPHHYQQQQQQHRPRPPPPQLPGSPSLPPPPSPQLANMQALERLMRESDRFSNVNPADGSILRSLPRCQQPSPKLSPQQRPQQRGPPGWERSHEDNGRGGPPRTPPDNDVAAARAEPSPIRSLAPTRHQRRQYQEGRVTAAGSDGEGWQQRPDSSHGEGESDEEAYLPHLQATIDAAFPPLEQHCDDGGVERGSLDMGESCSTSHLLQSQQQQQQNRPRPPRPVGVGGGGATSPGPPPHLRPPLRPRAAAVSSSRDWVDVDEEDEEDRLNLHNRATVDIILPVPLDSLMKSLDYAKKSSKLRRKRFPVVIIVTGGAWIIGSHLWGTMLARVLAQRGYVVFCPDYRNFPQTTMEGMTLDVSDAIGWVLNNAERYNGDLDNVTLVGQSAGAHLTMMSLLSQAHLLSYEAARGGGGSASHHRDGVSAPPPSDVAYNVPRYNPRFRVHRYIGLSGGYNLERLVPHFAGKGLNTPVLEKIAGGRDQFARYSLHAYFDRRRGGDTGEVLPDNFFDFMPPRMFFLHGDADTAAPVTESSSLVGVMRLAQMEFTLRRLTRNEENRRHAFCSRGVVAGALAAMGSGGRFDAPLLCATEEADGDVDGTSGEEERGPYSRSDDDDDNSNNEGGPRRSHLLSPIVPPSRSDLPLPAVELEFILIPDATHSDAIVEECIVGLRSCCADFICDYVTDGSGGGGGGDSSGPHTASSAAASPVLQVPNNANANANSSSGAWIVTADGRVTSATQNSAAATTATMTAAATATATTTAETEYVRLNVEKMEKWSRTVDHCVPPDGILPLAVPREDRPRLLNWVSYFTPF